MGVWHANLATFILERRKDKTEKTCETEKITINKQTDRHQCQLLGWAYSHNSNTNIRTLKLFFPLLSKAMEEWGTSTL